MSYAYLAPWQQPYGSAVHDPVSATLASIGSFAAANSGLLAGASAAATIAGAGISYMGAQQQAQSSAAADTYAAQVAANNQNMANSAATQALQQGQVEQQQKAQAENLLVGQQKAGLAANGIDVGSGTAIDLLGDTKAAGMLDQLTIEHNAQITRCDGQ